MESKIMSGALYCAIALFALSAWSGPITVDGSLDDWGVNPPSPIIPNYDGQWGPPTVGSYAADHSVGEKGFVGPGRGGHAFDLVAKYSHLEGRALYLAFVIGFDIRGVVDPLGKPATYYMGDVFFDFGSDGGWFYNTNQDYKTGEWDLAFGLSETLDPNTTHLNAYTDFSVVATPHGVTGWRAGPYQAIGGKPAGEVEFAFVYGSDENGMVDTNGNYYHVYEFRYELEDDMLAAIRERRNYRVFVTMTCGNDYIDFIVDVPGVTRARGASPVQGSDFSLFGRRGGAGAVGGVPRGGGGGMNFAAPVAGMMLAQGAPAFGVPLVGGALPSLPPRGGFNPGGFGFTNPLPPPSGPSAGDPPIIPLPPAAAMALAGIATLLLYMRFRRVAPEAVAHAPVRSQPRNDAR